MKLSATIASAALAATLLVSATAANAATALITETYDGGFDAAFLHIKNTGAGSFTFTVSGGYAGGSGSGSLTSGSTFDFYLGDNEADFPGSQGTALVSITAGNKTASGSFTDTIGDPDFDVGPVTLGSLTTVPEPASWAMLLTGFGLLGGALRVMRASRTKAVAA